MMVDETGNLSAMSLTEFRANYSVDQKTIWRWNNYTPDLAMKIRERRDEIVPLARETAAFNRLFLIGMSSLGTKTLHRDQKSAVEALKTYVGHYSNLQLPAQRQVHEIGGGLADLLQAGRTLHDQKPEVIEGEVADASN
jgi:hypothetical protein